MSRYNILYVKRVAQRVFDRLLSAYRRCEELSKSLPKNFDSDIGAVCGYVEDAMLSLLSIIDDD